MNFKQTYKKSITMIYILAEILLYGSFLYIDIKQKASYNLSAQLKFTGIALCFLYVLISSDYLKHKTDIRILRLALFFTLISDLFILMLDLYLPGMVSFCVVQALYLIRLGLWNKREDKLKTRVVILKKFLRNIILTLAIFIILAIFQLKLETLIFVSCFYFVGILFNVFDSMVTAIRYRFKYQLLYSCGMVLFLLCDINVGVFNLTGFVSVNSGWFPQLYNFSVIAMWLFYLPAQVFISLSGQTKDM